MTTFQHESIAALPVSGAASKALIRAMVTRRIAYVLADDEDAQNFVAVDPDAGTLPIYLIQNSALFKYDSTDSTTAHDGTTCLVSSDGKRYKTATLAYPDSVLDKDLTAPPTSPTPSLGDTYIVATSATGDWAGHDDAVAIYTASGWQFVTIPIGRFVYVRDETAMYHRNADGDWTRGVGSLAFSTNAVPVSSIIGKPVRWHVINQTTNAPPTSPAPTIGNAYIIGSSPTGAWAGNANKIAISEDGSTFTIYTPRTGERAYDLDTNADLRYDGTSWVSSEGAWVGRKSVFTASGSTTLGASTTSYNYNSATAPTDSIRNLADTATLTYTARKSGSILRFNYVVGDVKLVVNLDGTGTGDHVIALFRDSESNALAWSKIAIQDFLTNTNGPGAITTFHTNLNMSFQITASDALSHTYIVRMLSRYQTGTKFTDFDSPTRRLFSVEEALA